MESNQEKQIHERFESLAREILEDLIKETKEQEEGFY
jgi:hypothetical protein